MKKKVQYGKNEVKNRAVKKKKNVAIMDPTPRLGDCNKHSCPYQPDSKEVLSRYFRTWLGGSSSNASAP